jgi:CRP/FNR family cyclic AMP-dependent transcriptional regulator
MLEHLKDVAPFDTLSDAELDPLVSRAAVRKYKKNTLVIHQGDETDSLYILREGQMKVYVEDENGREHTVRIMQEGDSFGELALVGDFPRSANVMTLSEASAFVISKANFMDCLRHNPDFSFALIQSLAHKVRDTTSELTHLALSDVYGRLVHIMEKYAQEQDGKPCFPKFTHREIANMIGSSREMVSKILKDLEKGDYITVSQNHYVINKSLPSSW